MVLHGLKRIFQKPTPDLSSSDRTNQLRSKTVYSGTVELSKTLDKPDNNRYKTYNGPFEIAKKNLYTDATLVASTSYKDLLDITKGKVLLNQLPLTNLTYPYYEKNFGNGELYVGNYQQFDGSKFHTSGPTGCIDSILVYDLSTTGFTGRNSYSENSIGYPGPTGMLGSNQDIFIDPKHCYYSDPCASSASYMNFVEIDFKSPTGTTGASGITGSSQYFAQQIINGNQYSGFRFPMSNFTLTCKQPIDSQEAGPLFCPALQPTLSGFSISSVNYSPSPSPFTIPPPTSNSAGAFSYTSSNPSVATINGNTITTGNAGTVTITATQAASGIYSSGTITTTFTVGTASPTFSPWTISSAPYNSTSFQITPPTSTSTGAFSFTVTGPSPLPSISNNTVDITGVNVGTYTITATQAAAGNYASGSIPASFDVTPIAPTFTSNFIIDNVNYNSTPFQLTPPTSTNLEGAFSFTVISGPSPPPSISNITTVDITGVNIGTYTILATQAATNNYGSINQPASFDVLAIPPTFTGPWNFVPPSVNYSPTPSPFQITPPTSNSGGTFSYTSSDTSVVTINGNMATAGNAGTATITAVQAVYGNYTSGSIISTTFTVNQISPNLSLSLPTVNTSTPSPFSLTPYTSTSSSAPVSYGSSNSSVATINANMITIVGAGTTTITASQVAYGNYTVDSTDSPLSIVTPSLPPNLSLSLPISVDFDTFSSPFSLTQYTSTSSSAPVSYSSSNHLAATISGSDLTIVNSGITTITATQASYGEYISATTSAQFIILQTIYSQDATNPVVTTTNLISPEIPNLQPGMTLYGGTLQYSNADTTIPLNISFHYNSGPEVYSQSFTITQTSGTFNFTFNPPIVWTLDIQHSIQTGAIVWPNAEWYQNGNTFSPNYLYNSDNAYLSRWVGTLTYYTTPPPPPTPTPP
jgi:hypothetical protein